MSLVATFVLGLINETEQHEHPQLDLAAMELPTRLASDLNKFGRGRSMLGRMTRSWQVRYVVIDPDTNTLTYQVGDDVKGSLDISHAKVKTVRGVLVWPVLRNALCAILT